MKTSFKHMHIIIVTKTTWLKTKNETNRFAILATLFLVLKLNDEINLSIANK